MSYCHHCGKEVEEGAVVCTQCGFATINKEEVVVKKKNFVAMKVFLIIGCIFNAFYLIPLCWCVPMTIYAFNRIEKGEKFSIAFKICTTLFLSGIAGIMMLCDNN